MFYLVTNCSKINKLKYDIMEYIKKQQEWTIISNAIGQNASLQRYYSYKNVVFK